MVYDFVFVVLVFRNTNDLIEFFSSLSTPNSKVIVVNSFFDEASNKEFETISRQNDADFLSVPNRGYGAGNNRGCEYALKHYLFKYLIISNADVLVEKLEINQLTSFSDEIIAPDIVNLRGKHQNPHLAFPVTGLTLKTQYCVYKYNLPKLRIIFSALSRISKSLFYLINRTTRRNKIFAAHGAFFLIPHSTLQKMFPLFDENVFMYGEETHVGLLAKKNGIITRYVPDIIIKHKEDGSTSLTNLNMFNLEKQSFECLINYWYGNI